MMLPNSGSGRTPIDRRVQVEPAITDRAALVGVGRAGLDQPRARR